MIPQILFKAKDAAICTDVLIRTSETESDPEMRQRHLKDAHKAKDNFIAMLEERGIGWRIGLVHELQAMGLYIWSDEQQTTCEAQVIFDIKGNWFD